MLQSAEAPGTDLNNGMLAGMAGHPFWLHYMRLMAGRAHLVANSLLRDGDRILSSTGPRALTAAFGTFMQRPPGSFLPGEHRLNSSIVHVYAVSEWFQPCACRDQECQVEVDWSHIRGHMDPLVIGNHLCLASWLHELKARNFLQTALAIAALMLAVAAGLLCWQRHAGRRASKRSRDSSKA